MTLCQVTTSEVDDATKLLEKARQKLQGIQNIPSQRVADLEAAIRQLRQIGCILDSCTISASYEVTQAQKSILQLHHTARVSWCFVFCFLMNVTVHRTMYRSSTSLLLRPLQHRPLRDLINQLIPNATCFETC